jgi:hypothetical protein
VRSLLALSVVLAAALASPGASADVASCIAASEGSLTLRQQGKLHDSLHQLAICADASCPDEVKTECARRIDAVNAAMPTLILAARDGAGNDLSDVRVSMDGAPLASALDGRPRSIDPGEHVFVFEMAGQAPVERRLVLREGERDRREEVVIGAPPPPAGGAPTAPAPAAPSGWTPQRTLAVVGGGLGLVGVGLGTSWGLYAISSQNREKGDCPASGSCNHPQASEDYTTAKQDATASTIAFVAGAAFLAAGAVLWFSAPSLRVVPAAGARGGGLLLVGDF